MGGPVLISYKGLQFTFLESSTVGFINIYYCVVGSVIIRLYYLALMLSFLSILMQNAFIITLSHGTAQYDFDIIYIISSNKNN